MTERRFTSRSRVRPAFTLVEILVVISLLALLAAMAVPMFQTDKPDRQMQLASDRLVSLMAMCRAQAMLNGHPVQLEWQTAGDDPTAPPAPLVVHEADPIAAPGEFKPMAASWATEPVLPLNVRIRLVQLGEFDLSSLVTSQGRYDLPADPALQTVQFHPDGTADPAVFVLTIRMPEGSGQDELQGWIIIDGVSGLAHAQTPPTADQFDAMLKAQAALPDLQAAGEGRRGFPAELDRLHADPKRCHPGPAQPVHRLPGRRCRRYRRCFHRRCVCRRYRHGRGCLRRQPEQRPGRRR